MCTSSNKYKSDHCFVEALLTFCISFFKISACQREHLFNFLCSSFLIKFSNFSWYCRRKRVASPRKLSQTDPFLILIIGRRDMKAKVCKHMSHALKKLRT